MIIKEIPSDYKGFKKLKDSPAEIYYRYYFDGYDEELKKNVYIVNIVSACRIKVANVKYLFKAMDIIPDEMLIENPEMNTENSISFTSVELKQGIKFVPDIRMYESRIQAKERVKIVAPGGVVIVLDSILTKSINFILETSKYFAKGDDIAVVKTYEEVNKKFQEFRQRIINKAK